jgi:sulfur-oxidizing protein SoxZ
MKALYDEAAGAYVVKAIIKHAMETGQRKDAKTGQLIPQHFIREVVCEHNGKPALSANWGTAVSKDPYLSFQVRGAKPGDKLSLRWTDNKGDSDKAEIAIA